MKKLEEIENTSLEELMAIADSSERKLPEGARERLDAILACEREVECSERQSGSFGRPVFAGLAASLAFACIVAFFVVTGVRNRTPQDTFSDPRLAYAEVEKAFARIGNEVNRGAKMAGKSGEVLAKPAEIINNITGSGNVR